MTVCVYNWVISLMLGVNHTRILISLSPVVRGHASVVLTQSFWSDKKELNLPKKQADIMALKMLKEQKNACEVKSCRKL